MAEEPENKNPQENENPEFTIEDVVAVELDQLTDEQKTFLEENKDNLTDEQKEKYGLAEKKEEPPTEPEVREVKQEEKEPEGEPEEIDPDDEKAISKVIDKKLKPIEGLRSEIQHLKDEREVDAFIVVKPEYAKYRDAMLKYISHSAYKNIPVYNIAAIVASKDMLKLGAEKEREAQKKAQETKGGGQPFRKPGGEKIDWSTASKEAFEEQKNKVLGRQGA